MGLYSLWEIAFFPRPEVDAGLRICVQSAHPSDSWAVCYKQLQALVRLSVHATPLKITKIR